MQTLYPPNDEGSTSPGDGDDDVLSQELKNNFNAVRTLLDNNNTTAAQNMATKTAIQATEEISRLTNGIAELEALLAQQQEEQQQQQDDSIPLPVVAFPSLPPVVVEQEEEESTLNKGKGELVSS